MCWKFNPTPPLTKKIKISDSFVIERSRKLNPRVTLNIGGEHHDVMWATLQKIPNSRLCKLAQAKTHSNILVIFWGSG
jgi:hypothetical protein